MLMLPEGWAEPVADEQPALLIPFSETASPGEGQIRSPTNTVERRSHADPPNLVRDLPPPYADRLGIDVDFERWKRRR